MLNSFLLFFCSMVGVGSGIYVYNRNQYHVPELFAKKIRNK